LLNRCRGQNLYRIVSVSGRHSLGDGNLLAVESARARQRRLRARLRDQLDSRARDVETLLKVTAEIERLTTSRPTRAPTSAIQLFVSQVSNSRQVVDVCAGVGKADSNKRSAAISHLVRTWIISPPWQRPPKKRCQPGLVKVLARASLEITRLPGQFRIPAAVAEGHARPRIIWSPRQRMDRPEPIVLLTLFDEVHPRPVSARRPPFALPHQRLSRFPQPLSECQSEEAARKQRSP
jgi:hypothetical protein